MSERTRSFLDQRREALAASPAAFNGIAGIEVDPADGTRLILRFVKATPGPAGVPAMAQALAPGDFSITGGDRIRSVSVESVQAAGDDLELRLNREGDFSTYTLAIDDDLPGFDPILREITFRFRVHCDTDLDCEEPAGDLEEPASEPRLDYLARDYESYRTMILDRLAVTTPDMVERNPASLEIALVEWLAYIGDQLSYKLDRVATEYSLETAQLRRSAARHARLVGYRMHNGVSARVLAQVEVNAAAVPLARRDLAFITRSSELDVPVVAMDRVPQAAARGATVFEPAHDMLLRQAHNRIGLHHWGDPDAVLARGSTEAWLRDPERVLDLRAGDLLILVEERNDSTGRAADADPAHRQAVRLVSDPETVLDPLEEVSPGVSLQVHRITWGPEDALPFELCVGLRPPGEELAVALGNIVVADHGMTLPQAEPLGIAPDTTDPEQPPAPGLPDEVKALAALDRPRPFAPMLAHRDLTYSAGPFTVLDPLTPAARITAMDPASATADMHLSVAGQTGQWQPLSDLLSAGAEDRVFVPEVTQDGEVTLRFGQGHGDQSSSHGKTPVAGDQFFAHYRVGSGRAGNIGADALAHIGAAGVALANVVRVRNPLPAAGGVNRESIAEVRQRAPVSFYEQRRAVTLADYEDLLNKHPDVQRAHARKRWLGSWSAIFLSVDRVGGLEVDEDFANVLLDYLEPYRMMGHDLTIDAPIYVPLEVALKACVLPDHFARDVAEALRDAFSIGLREDGEPAFFHPDRVTFSSQIYLSGIYHAAMQVPGVEDIHVETFKRASALSSTAMDDGLISFGPREIPVLANDPNHPDQGTLTIKTEGGR
ncbi:MAG: putative baseplate assembly protein [Halieaceae bacterium]|jgi:hypothetical protein|nr:putative baseplate assembly protein [Halieaceae bacterium]